MASTRSVSRLSAPPPLLKDGQPAVGETLRCSVKQEGNVVETKVFQAAGEPVTVEGTMDRPGWLYFGFEVLDESGRPQKGPGFFKHRAKPTIVGEIGAMLDPDKIRALPARPADFEAYWADLPRPARRSRPSRLSLPLRPCPKSSRIRSIAS